MVRAGDLFGDGVNIAARLQSIAKPGGVCISGATYDQIRKVLPITFADLGVLNVKNIQEPIRAYRAVNETTAPELDANNDRGRMNYSETMTRANIQASQAVDEFNAALQGARTKLEQQQDRLADENKLLAELRRGNS